MTIRTFFKKGKAYRNPFAAVGPRLGVVQLCLLDKCAQRVCRRPQAAEQIFEVSLQAGFRVYVRLERNYVVGMHVARLPSPLGSHLPGPVRWEGDELFEFLYG